MLSGFRVQVIGKRVMTIDLETFSVPVWTLLAKMLAHRDKVIFHLAISVLVHELRLSQASSKS